MDIENCKWICTTNDSEIGTDDDSKYTGGNFESNPQTLTLDCEEDQIYYLHVLTVDKVGNKKETISDAISTALELNEGNYVKYNGLDCRVLYNDDTHGIQIITSESVETVALGYEDTMVASSDFQYDGTASVDDNFLKTAASYNNLVDNLNNKAKTYMDTKGIATDARCLGSIPTLTSDAKFQGDTTSEMWSGTETYWTTYSWNNKFKNKDTNYLEDVNQIKNLGLNAKNENIWLATRQLNVDTYTVNLCGRYLRNGTSNSVTSLGRVVDGKRGDFYTRSNGLCPVFLLPSDIKISSGDGSSDSPFIIE